MTQPEAQPSLAYETSDGVLVVRADEAVVSRDAILDTAFAFVDRCFVYVGGAVGTEIPVRLEPRESATEEQLDALAAELAGLLAENEMRNRIALSAGQIRDYYTTRALFGTGGTATLDELLSELDDEELEDDDLEINVPWNQPSE